VAVGKIGGGRVILVDSTNTKANKKENGVHVIGKKALLQRWTSDEGFTAILVSK